MKAAGKADAAATAKLVVVAVDRRNAIKMEYFLLLIFFYTFVSETSKNKRTVEQNSFFWRKLENFSKFLLTLLLGIGMAVLEFYFKHCNFLEKLL